MGVSALWSLGITIALIALPIAVAADAKYHDIPLYVSQGKMDEIDQAVVDGADFNEPSKEGRLSLVTAAEKNELHIARTLLAYYAKPGGIEPSTNETAMVVAFRKNHTDMAALLMQYGGDPNHPDGNGVTPRSLVEPNTILAHYVEIYDKEGSAGFEDPPGAWHVNTAKEHDDALYYYNVNDGRRTYLQPVSCFWVRTQDTDHISYINLMTHQHTYERPKALAWKRTLDPQGVPYWFNYRANVSLHWTPIEIPQSLLSEYIKDTGVYWQNIITGEMSYEDPRWEYWVQVPNNQTGRSYWFHPSKPGDVWWDLPVHMSWEKSYSKEHKMDFYYNPNTNESVWDKPTAISWVQYNFVSPELLGRKEEL